MYVFIIWKELLLNWNELMIIEIIILLDCENVNVIEEEFYVYFWGVVIELVYMVMMLFWNFC